MGRNITGRVPGGRRVKKSGEKKVFKVVDIVSYAMEMDVDVCHTCVCLLFISGHKTHLNRLVFVCI